ncbi:glycosyltransferase family 32 protein [Snodgrassella sp. ESL0324]|uniref:glycosyltransferase family 32 protein n=1 Tax=Snodgrassella sp. ESL0324 TaxID=2705033 RepID=UPI00158199A3|nr:glycosyltransferase [Snodgrassella sp. ESL0324]NUF10161.1 glycosyl transferase [Snodgrassella sp. ESL0324]
MIPKLIHYCWFGPQPLPATTRQYIASWRQFLPDYQIQLWNEHNFDYQANAYTRSAYAAGKYAFVADVCRIQALYQHGGIYLDTDVQMIASFDPFLHHHCFTGFEQGMNPYTRELTCNPQAGVMGCEAGSILMQDIRQQYQNLEFNPQQLITINQLFKQIYQKHGIILNDQRQEIPGYVCVYPSDYFMAKNAYTHELNRTANTVCIHHYDGTWLNDSKGVNRLKRRILNTLRTTLGARNSQKLIALLKRKNR